MASWVGTKNIAFGPPSYLRGIRGGVGTKNRRISTPELPTWKGSDTVPRAALEERRGLRSCGPAFRVGDSVGSEDGFAMLAPITLS